ncbi:hypothetical protein LOTGIDRAFT_172963 [Lottia gigantea]|uniref:DUF4524 domain-containing protein n=1 Tax=Lottia gigantea TaxID=225164 RepID=V4AUA2_LOTGI|nr:hypothetical protein LOTGIDRAFT_172963 [Lottia gigantea]ESP00863.1 hypothetical protein LOTGIDRAFT_172963 [Lottia gigantea]
MTSVPALMVLYSNDSVEIRYTDKTRLQLSPCGSTLIHFDNPDSGSHPVYGVTRVQQRVRFVTSNNKQKVLQALDFRNRFSERPYLCRELIPKSEITGLYNNIREVKWNITLESGKYEILPDGSIRLMSVDEFASLVLSAHGRDFTVCYLSKISEDPKKHKDKTSPKLVRAKTDFSVSGVQSFQQQNDAIHRSSTPPNIDLTLLDNGSSPEFKIDPVYTQRVSTPTKHKTVSINETPIVTPYGPTAIFKSNQDNSPINNLHELSSISRISSEGLNGTIETVDISLVPGEHCRLPNKQSSDPFTSHNSSDSNSSNQNKEESSVRYYYTWVTRHYSTSQCPIIWSHPLKLANQVLENPKVLNSLNKKTQPILKLDDKDVVKSCLPLPQPLTCPYQHLHRWSTGQEEYFQSGRIGMVMADGVIFRLVYLPSMTTVEMFPGDGSVIYSHGVSGQFYQHLLFKNNKLEERSYSIKSLPPPVPNSTYSIQKIVQRGSRFLKEAVDNDKHTRREELPCWRHEESKRLERVTCEILEECTVPGRGKFMAYTNGRIRIVFEDRTALDMVCDFSTRLHSCLHQHGKPDHSPQEKMMPRVTGFDKLMGRESCRLLLPNGQYILVDITKPGIYDRQINNFRYISAAKEWAKWVNSLPKDRGKFYQNMATAAVQPLDIVENTVLNQLPGTASQSTDSLTKPSLDSFQPAPYSSYLPQNFNQLTLGGAYSDSGYSLYPSQYSSYATRNCSSAAYNLQQSSHQKEAEIFNGFNSVRQALLKTSKLINDIDDILEKTPETLK